MALICYSYRTCSVLPKRSWTERCRRLFLQRYRPRVATEDDVDPEGSFCKDTASSHSLTSGSNELYAPCTTALPSRNGHGQSNADDSFCKDIVRGLRLNIKVYAPRTTALPSRNGHGQSNADDSFCKDIVRGLRLNIKDTARSHPLPSDYGKVYAPCTTALPSRNGHGQSEADDSFCKDIVRMLKVEKITDTARSHPLPSNYGKVYAPRTTALPSRNGHGQSEADDSFCKDIVRVLQLKSIKLTYPPETAMDRAKQTTPAARILSARSGMWW
ncbi:hypothetical protein BDV93DRAFT_565512 [Ceratobasidium sp. AG-I]|nr:hypothetical protein BDV93DRAFT_565512 [Ceratobasidium sp. AG-I]